MSKLPYAKCESCPLNRRGKAVPARGPQDADLVVVGEAPGQEEIRQGKPFVGQSGQLLDAVLGHHGIPLERVRYTNVVACRPPRNQDPPPDAVACCHPRLLHELGDNGTVLAVGNYAATVMLGYRTKITRDRIGPPKLVDGRRVIATIHPAAVLRAGDNFDFLVTDVGKIKSTYKVKWQPPEYKLLDDPGSARIALTQLLNAPTGRITLDIETRLKGQIVEKDEEFVHPAEILCIGVGYQPGKVIVATHRSLADPRVREAISALARRSDLTEQNGKFDNQVLNLMGYGRMRLGHDTMLASYCLDERPGTHSLQYLAVEMLGAPKWKGKETDEESWYKRNAIDCATTWDLRDLQEPRLEEEGQVKLHRFLCEVSDMLADVEQRGMVVDAEAIDKLATEMEAEIDVRKDVLRTLGDQPDLNPNSPQQLHPVLERLYDSRFPSTDADTLKIALSQLSAEDGKFISELLAYRKIAKMYGTYVKGTRKRIEGRTGRVHTTFKLHGTVTGRLSSVNPNIQNVLRGSKIRSIYVAEPDSLILYGDYKNIEGRVVCVESKCEPMRAIFLEGRDLHSEAAANFFGDNFTKEQRVLAKTIIHGVNYMRSAVGVASDPDINTDVRTAQKFIDSYFGMFPELPAWQNEIIEQILDPYAHLTTAFGRKRRFGLITPQNREDVYKEGVAFKPQSIGSDITLSAGLKLHAMGFDIRMFIHDGILCQCPKDHIHEMARVMKSVMEETAAEVYSDYVPFEAEIEVGTSWGSLTKLDQ